MKHDETKLPKWAQKRLAQAREDATYMTFYASETTAIPGHVTIEVELGRIVNVIGGDRLRIDIAGVKHEFAEAFRLNPVR